jgi:hypothetical protein
VRERVCVCVHVSMCVCVVCIQMGGILLKSYVMCVRVYACMCGMYTDGTELLQTPSHRKRFQLKPCSNFDVCVLSLSRSRALSLSLSLSLARSLSAVCIMMGGSIQKAP